MKKKLVSLAIVCCLAFQSGAAVVPALAKEPDNDAAEELSVDEDTAAEQEEVVSDAPQEEEVEAEPDDSSEEQPDEIDDAEETDEVDDTTEYINGIPVDYDDPECVKRLNALDGGGIQTFATTTSSISTKWKGVTYYHDEDIAKGKTILPGVDVSKWEGYSGSTTAINWSSVANDGIEFTFIRLGYTSTASSFQRNMDPVYYDNIEKALNAGVMVGVYYFSQAITVSEAQKEAQYVLDNLGGYSLDLPIVMDYEYGGGRLTSSTPNKATKTEICNAFCKVIEDAGYTACVYADSDMLTNSLNHSDIDNNYLIWMAQWRTGPPTYTGTYTFWQCCGADSSKLATVNGISGYIDLDWWYMDPNGQFGNGVVKTGSDIEKINGTWTYTVNGEPDYSYTGLAKNSNGWYYMKDGVLDRSYTGFASNENGSWYITEGKLTRKDNTVLQDTKGAIGTKNEWYYVVGSKVQSDFTGLANYKNTSGWWYITKGKVDRSVNTVAKNKNGWYYVVNGKVQKSFSGLANYKNENGWWYITNGKLNRSVNTVAKNKNGWFYVVNGKVQKSFTGLADYKNESGWWYITNGRVDRTFTGIAKNKNGTYYVKNGKVQKSFSGTVTINGTKYSVKNGKVTS